MDQQNVVMSMTAPAPRRTEPPSRGRESSSVEGEKSSFSNELEGAMERGEGVSSEAPEEASESSRAADAPEREEAPEPAEGQAVAAVAVAVAPPLQPGEPTAIPEGERATAAANAVVLPSGWRAPSGGGPVAATSTNLSPVVEDSAETPLAGTVQAMTPLAEEEASRASRRTAGNERMLAELARQASSPEGVAAGRGEGAAASVSLGSDSVQVAVAGVGGASSRPDAAAAAQANALPRFLAVDVPFNDPRWQGDFSQRVALMARAGNGQAEIKLNPAHLGPVEVRISINEDQQASVTFFAKHGAVREAIEASLPRLREMFSSQGLELAGSSVSDQSPGPRGEGSAGRGDRGGAGAGQGSGFASEPELEPLGPELASRLVVMERGGLDLYV